MNYLEVDGIIILNCTPHEIRFQNRGGEVVTCPCSGLTLKATAEERVGLISPRLTDAGVETVTTTFKVSEEGRAEYAAANAWASIRDEPVAIVGSIISAMAFARENSVVFSLVPVPGTERNPPAEKLYLANKFSFV